MIDVLIILLLLMLNGVFAMSEIALVSASRVRLEADAAKGSRSARRALQLSQDPSRLLSVVQIGITLIGIFSGAFGEARLSRGLAEQLRKISWLAESADKVAFVIVVILLTYATLLIGELVPKRVGMAFPEAIAKRAAGLMGIMAAATRPFVAFLAFSTNLALGVIGLSKARRETVSDADVTGLIAEGAKSGVFEQAEHEIVERVFQLSDLRVKSLMVPRNEIVWIDADCTPDRLKVVVATSPHSHFPVCRGGLDDVLGVLHIKDLIKSGLVSGSDPVDIANLAQPPMYVPEGTLALKLLERFKNENRHIALVVDEFGGTEGLVSLNDLVSVIVAASPSAARRTALHPARGWFLPGRRPHRAPRPRARAGTRRPAFPPVPRHRHRRRARHRDPRPHPPHRRNRQLAGPPPRSRGHGRSARRQGAALHAALRP